MNWNYYFVMALMILGMILIWQEDLFRLIGSFLILACGMWFGKHYQTEKTNGDEK